MYLCPSKPAATVITLISEEETGGSSSGISVLVGSSFRVKQLIYKANSFSVAPINAVASLKSVPFFIFEYSSICSSSNFRAICVLFFYLKDDIYGHLHSSFQ